jgi:TolB-like protein
MLSSRLSESKQLVIIESERVEEALKDIKPSLVEVPLDEMDVRITSVGKRLKADFLISGSLIEAGGHRIDVQVFETKSGEMVSKHFADSAGGVDSINQLATDLVNILVKVGTTQPKQIIISKKKIAVLYFKNLASEEYDAFVGSMPTMLEASLKKSEEVSLIERDKIQKQLKGFELEPGGVLDQNKAIQLGTSLGTDILLLGRFTMSYEVCQLNAVLIDAKTGNILDKQGAGGDEANLMMLPGKLGEKLTTSLRSKDVSWERESTIDITSTGRLEVEFRLTRAPMTERAVHYHICKLFVDGKFIKISPPVKKLNEWVTLFSEPLQVGEHEIEILHGYVTEEGNWKDKFHKQPRTFHVTIASSETTHIKYEYKVDLFSDGYKVLRRESTRFQAW